MNDDPNPSDRRQVTFVPDNFVPECDDSERREVHRFELPDDFDRAATQAAHDKLKARDSCASAFVIILILLSPCLLVAAIWCAFFSAVHILALGLFLVSIACFLLSLVINVFVTRLGKATSAYSCQLYEDAKRQRELAHGLRAPNECDNPVSPSEWTTHMNRRANWAFGEEKMVLPTDIVVNFGWIDGPTSGRGGYAIKRGEKIAAEYVTWVS
jgi:hypothetical protein